MLERFEDGGVSDLMAKRGIYNGFKKLYNSLDCMKKSVRSIESSSKLTTRRFPLEASLQLFLSATIGFF